MTPLETQILTLCVATGFTTVIILWLLTKYFDKPRSYRINIKVLDKGKNYNDMVVLSDIELKENPYTYKLENKNYNVTKKDLFHFNPVIKRFKNRIKRIPESFYVFFLKNQSDAIGVKHNLDIKRQKKGKTDEVETRVDAYLLFDCKRSNVIGEAIDSLFRSNIAIRKNIFIIAGIAILIAVLYQLGIFDRIIGIVR